MTNIRQFPKKEEDKKEQHNKRMHEVHRQAMREIQAIIDKHNIDCAQVFMHTVDLGTDVNAFDAQMVYNNKMKGGFGAYVAHETTMLYMSYLAIDTTIDKCPWSAEIRDKIAEAMKKEEEPK